MSDVAVICVTVVPGMYALALVALMRLEYRPLREPRRERRQRVVVEAAAERLAYEIAARPTTSWELSPSDTSAPAERAQMLEVTR